MTSLVAETWNIAINIFTIRSQHVSTFYSKHKLKWKNDKILWRLKSIFVTFKSRYNYQISFNKDVDIRYVLLHGHNFNSQVDL